MAQWAKRAVIVVHGIGTQQRGDTLGALTEGFRAAGAEVGDAITETAPFGQPIPAPARRVARGRTEADVYEVYWAPHASNTTSARSVLGWVLRTTFLPGTSLRRPSLKTIFDLLVGALSLLLAAGFLLIALSSLGNLSAEATCAAKGGPECTVPFVERGLTGKSVTAGGIRQLTAAFLSVRESLAFSDRPLDDLSPSHAAKVLQSIRVRTWLFLAAIVYVTAQILFRLQQILRPATEHVGAQLLVLTLLLAALLVLVQPVPPVLIGFAWVFVAIGVLGRGAARFLSESIGDVQVYVQQDENREHFAVRQRVIAEAEATLALVGERDYERIVIIGHSLGSVVALDVLRRLVVRNPAMIDRLDAFVSLGTAIEKVRYAFERKEIAREVAAEFQGAVRSVLGDCAWVNLWYWNDPVANPITTFQEQAKPVRRRWKKGIDVASLLATARKELVVNVSFGFPLRPFPIWTHSRYWTDARVGRVLADIALP